MSGGVGGIRTGAAILLLLAAAAMAPVVDTIIGFLSEAPYVEYLAGAEETAAMLPSGHGGPGGRPSS